MLILTSRLWQGSAMLPVKAVIFDMDGVIVDSEPPIIEAKQQVLAAFGVHQPESYHFKFMGMSFQAIWDNMRTELNLPVSTEELLKRYFKAYQQLIDANGQQPIPGSLALINGLAAQGYRLALASSSPLADIQRTLTAFGVLDRFEVVLSGYELAHPKPAPDIFNMARAKLGLQPNQCVVVEDSDNGIRAAQAAGIQAIAFDDPRYHPQRTAPGVIGVTSFKQVVPTATGISITD
ncbi:HAD-IA family hydrolase [Loigolactobacillus bifermentans]|nr:HAD-IA family hydrolase [Loigolactobacillus bifermentans]